MTYTFKRKLMFTNKSPRRIDRRSGARNKKIILKSYQKIIKGKKKIKKAASPLGLHRP